MFDHTRAITEQMCEAGRELVKTLCTEEAKSRWKDEIITQESDVAEERYRHEAQALENSRPAEICLY